MRKLIFILCFSLIFVSAQAKRKQKTQEQIVPIKEVVVLNNEDDSVSYAMGILEAQIIKNLEKEGINTEILVKALNLSIDNDTTLMSVSEADSYIKDYEVKVKQQAIDMAIKQQNDFLTENRKREGVVETASGLQYQIVKQSNVESKPTVNSTVKVHYEGFLLDGTKFDSSIDRGQPIEFKVSRVIKGWTEGLQLMNVGSKFTLYIPYQLGYGTHGAGQAVPPYATLIFEVELLEVK